jgi:hypothetical protein
MRQLVLAGVLTIAIASCGKKTNEAAPTRAPSSSAPASSGGSASGTSASGTSKTPLSCAKLIPQALVDNYLAGYTLSQGPGIANAVSCKYSKGDAGAQDHLSVVLKCDDAMKAGMQQTISMTKNAKPAPGVETSVVTGLGAGAIMSKTTTPPATNLTVWDDDTNCTIVVTAMGPAQANVQALAKDLVAAVTPAALQ